MAYSEGGMLRWRRLLPAPHALQSALAEAYLFEGELGGGEAVTAYLARDLGRGGQVVVKMVHAKHAASLGTDRFLREIQLSARLRHPGIIPMLDSGTVGTAAGPLFWYVLGYVEAETLRHRLDGEHQMGLERALALAREAADALDFAHRQGAAHGDIKPEHILVSQGRAVIADFAAARLGIASGTPEYMSPERLAGGAPDAAGDIYALGCVLYEMLAGRAPFSGGGQAREVPAVSQVRPTVPPAVEAAITRALDPAPHERFATAADFAAELPSGPAPVEPRRHGVPLSVLLVGTGLVIAAIAILISRCSGFHPESGAPPLGQTLQSACSADQSPLVRAPCTVALRPAAASASPARYSVSSTGRDSSSRAAFAPTPP